jgi:hypothetical protein
MQAWNVNGTPLLSNLRAVYPDQWEEIPAVDLPEFHGEPDVPIVGDEPLPGEEPEPEELTLIDIKDFVSEAMVEDQQDILLHEHEQNVERPTDLRPIVSVRDYLRRFNRGYYRRLTSSLLDATRGTIQVDVAEIFGVRGPQLQSASIPTSIVPRYTSPQRLINSMFLGYSGGVRFKIGVVGCNLAEVYYVPPGFHDYSVDPEGNRVWRSTEPIPPTSSAPPTGGYRESAVGIYQFAEKLDNPFITTTTHCPLPMQERPNYLMASAEQDVGLDLGASDNRMAFTTSVFEVEVPHMTPFRFVGDTTKGFIPTTGTEFYQTATNNMGHLILKMAQPLLYFPSVATINQNIAVEIFVASDDVGRAGYQVFAPITVLPAVRATNGLNVNDYQINSESVPSNAVAGFYPGLVSSFISPANSIVPAFDYTKSLYKTVV